MRLGHRGAGRRTPDQPATPPRQAASPSRDEPFYAAYARHARELTPPQRAQLIVKPDAMAEQAGGGSPRPTWRGGGSRSCCC
ncbi:hypothetical protein RBXJA2T_00490 [Rubrivivax benzoatilyticus JA2 = ATCC BAA-35]|nr:hypothetical protein RBXJA2T_00490 [Rubrivivax benzoatilyticus JA2 = ATCC BAA-35]